MKWKLKFWCGSSQHFIRLVRAFQIYSFRISKKQTKSINSTMTTAMHGIVWQVYDPLVNTQWNSSIFNIFISFSSSPSSSQTFLILLTLNVGFLHWTHLSLSVSFPISIEIENNLSQISSEVEKSNKNHFSNEIDACFENLYTIEWSPVFLHTIQHNNSNNINTINTIIGISKNKII